MAEQPAAVFELIFAAASRLGAAIREVPPEWTGDRFNSEVLAAGAGGDSERAEHDLPRTISARLFDDVPVLLADITGVTDQDSFDDVMRRHRNQAAITRSWLGPSAANLQMFLVGPTASARKPFWRRVSAEIEVDDRVCRKLVWLPPASATVEHAAAFLSRTFLARPWEMQPPAEAAHLDRMDEIVLPEGWSEIIDDDALDSEAVVRKLIALDEGTAR